MEKLRRKGCCGDGRRESHGGGDDGARGGCGDGGCHAGAGAGRRRVRVAPEGLRDNVFGGGSAVFGGGSAVFGGGRSAGVVLFPHTSKSITRGGEVRDLTPESLARTRHAAAVDVTA